MSDVGSKAADADGHESQLPLVSELAPEVEAVAERLAALPLPRLAAEVMTNAFKPEYEPGGWGTTRLGRAALTDGSVEPRVVASAPSA